MNILVTGATGFVGQHLMQNLTKAFPGESFFGSNTSYLNLKDYGRSDEWYGLPPLDFIIHLACYTQAGDWCKTHSGVQWLENQQINTNVLRYWRDHQRQAKFIALGTSCSYPPSHFPYDECEYLTGSPDEDLYAYAHTKRMLLIGLQSISKQWPEMEWTYLIPSTLFGTYFSETDNHFIFDMIRKIHAMPQNNGKAILWGDGYQTRELIHIDTFCEQLIKVMGWYINGLTIQNKEVFNISSGHEFSMREYAQIICRRLGQDSTGIVWDTSKFVGVRSKSLLPNKFSLFDMDCDGDFTSPSRRVMITQLNLVIDWYRETHGT